MGRANYGTDFFELAVRISEPSAKAVSQLVWDEIHPRNVLDVGCGRGVWLNAWKEQGAGKIVGLDGDYVERDKLLVPESSFIPTDLNSPFDLGERFDLIQSLEVAEHLEPESAELFVDSLVRHGDLILFSAAVVGQGGEGHLNERPLEYWRALFNDRGYGCYDWVRPALAGRRDIKPWYRFNTLFYAHPRARDKLSCTIASNFVTPALPLASYGDFAWWMRCALLSKLPCEVVNFAAHMRATLTSRRKANPPSSRHVDNV